MKPYSQHPGKYKTRRFRGRKSRIKKMKKRRRKELQKIKDEREATK